MHPVVALLILSFASIAGFIVAKNTQRRRTLWALLCFVCPVFLAYLVQLRAGEKATRELILRSAIAVGLLVIFIAFLSPLKPGNGIAAYERMFLSGASLIWDTFGITHFRDGSFFKTPRFTFDIPHGTTLYYYSFIFAATATIQSIFLRRRQPYVTAMFTVVFFMFGYLVSVAAIGVIILGFESPEQLNKQTMRMIGTISKSLGMLAVYFTVLAIAYATSRKQPQPTDS